MMKRLYAAIMAVFFIFAVGCKKEKEEDPTKADHDWTKEEVRESIGGIVEGNMVTIRDYLNEISWLYCYVEGYVTQVNPFTSDVISIADEMESTKEITVYLIVEHEEFKEGDYVYICGVIDEYDDYDIGEIGKKCALLVSSGNKEAYCQKTRVKNHNYMTVRETTRQINEVFFDTILKTKGVVYKEKGKYYLYPNDESRKEDKMLRIELILAEDSEVIIGKPVCITGNPILYEGSYQTMWNVYLSKDDD